MHMARAANRLFRATREQREAEGGQEPAKEGKP